ncbi:MAG: type IV secretory system conjugative DNA transfer family protein [Bacteroidia bacterium]
MINPFGLLGIKGDTYNPFDLVKDDTSKTLADDAQMLASLIVPQTPNQDQHFEPKARSLICGQILHLATTFPIDEPSLQLTIGQLWQMLRLGQDDWLELLKNMALNDHPIYGQVVNGAANEILQLMESGEREAASIISTARKWTDIFKSIPLRETLQSSSFCAEELSAQKTIVYVLIPAEFLQSHFAFTRLVIATLLKSIVRSQSSNYHHPVTFFLDEAYSLGYLQELEVAMGLYAGYGIRIWTIWQALSQLQQLYGKNWEIFISNSGIKHFFGVNDRTTMDYVSNMTGNISVPTYSQNGKKKTIQSSSSRILQTPDEVRRQNQMLVFIDNLPVAKLPKKPYYNHPIWSKRAEPNPYYRKG